MLLYINVQIRALSVLKNTLVHILVISIYIERDFLVLCRLIVLSIASLAEICCGEDNFREIEAR